MAVLKEFECERCNALVDEFVSGDCEVISLNCKQCGSETTHHSRCTGGIKSKWRYLSGWTPEYAEQCSGPNGDVEFTGVGAREEDTGNVVTNVRTGEVLHERSHFTNTDRRNERREKLIFERRQKRGANRIWSR